MGWEQKQLFNIHTKQEILVALGCKSLYKAAAAHVNNNAMALRCRRSTEGSWRGWSPWIKGRLRETTTGEMKVGIRGWLSLEGFDHATGWLAEQNLHRVHGLRSHQRFRQCVGIVRRQQLPDLPPVPLPVLPLWAVRHHLGLCHWGWVTLRCTHPPVLRRGQLSCRELRWTLWTSQPVVGVIWGRTAAVIEHGRDAVASVRPALRSGGRVRSVSACPMEALRAVEEWRHRGADAELQAWLYRLHVGAGAHSGDGGVGSALAECAGRCLSPM